MFLVSYRLLSCPLLPVEWADCQIANICVWTDERALSCVRDGVIGPEEMCDPGSVVANSGCDAHCRVVFGWTCDGDVGERSICDKSEFAKYDKQPLAP